MSYNYYSEDGEKDYQIIKFIYIIFHRPNNYTRVFLLVSNKPIWGNDLNKKNWQLECDHDSCWSSDGFNFIKRLKNQIINEFKQNDIEYKDINESVWLDDIKYIEFEEYEYEYEDYQQREVKLNFSIF
jgi:hypothetical protein